MARSHPVLSCRIVDDPDGRAVFVKPAAPPLLIWADRSDEPLPDLDGRAAVLHIVRESTDTAWVTLLTHHSAADGRHSVHLLADLWNYYTGLTEGRAVRPCRSDFPRSLEQVLTERGITAEKSEPGELPPPKPPMIAPTLRTSPRVRLTAEQTAALTQLARRAGTTLNGLASAALLQAVAEVDGLEIDQPVYGYPVDLRTRLTPPVGDAEGTNILGLAVFAATPETATDTETLAQAVTDQLARDLATGEVQRYYLRHPEHSLGMTYPRSGMPSASTTNWGVIPKLATPDGLTIDDFRPYLVTYKPGDVDALGWSYPRNSCILHTFEGQFTIDVVRPDTGAQLLADRIRANLTRLLPTA
ncbi:hypothetical protein NDR87_30015 [Nocardia sp. CDC159]|uniref:phthiocerol/phthiodiolone dimycocerosyl transferase family protein n=1 Tax=Nocardia TaxID=1817 RepID=UPI0020734047|nr:MULTISPECIES: hypothetical protein [Nocardia]MCM6790613.1 hypothetical protein [Nocardia sp. CDC159]